MQLKVSYYEVGFTIKINHMSFSAGNQSPSSRIHQVGSSASTFGSMMLGSHSACAQIPLFKLEKMRLHAVIYRYIHYIDASSKGSYGISTSSTGMGSVDCSSCTASPNTATKAELGRKSSSSSSESSNELGADRHSLAKDGSWKQENSKGVQNDVFGALNSNKILQHRLPCQQHRPGKATTSYKQNMKIMK